MRVAAMGKSDFLSPKAIANRIKSKGLQKLRWYCQMCQKQCRDEVRPPRWWLGLWRRERGRSPSLRGVGVSGDPL